MPLSSVHELVMSTLPPASPPLPNLSRLLSPWRGSDDPLYGEVLSAHCQKLVDYHGALAAASLGELGPGASDAAVLEAYGVSRGNFLADLTAASPDAEADLSEWIELYEADVDVSSYLPSDDAAGRGDQLETSDDEEEDEEPSRLRRYVVGPAEGWLRRNLSLKLWQKRVLNNFIAIGLNFLQGTLALRQVRREARKRDRQMPKFPL
mmetsp:Transcript_17034/g.34680  ORF Transcript_17034/g.34680 Transcript_17034/m.34680 type:complete len:207 (-) Transcript_17034:19-639(-)